MADLSESFKEIIAGSVAGGVGKLFEYPFDTVKVRMQAQPLNGVQYTSAIDCFTQTIRHEKLRGLYKGVSTPIVAAAAETSVLFAVYNYFDNMLIGDIQSLGTRSAVCGSLSGLAASGILTPIEYVKCRVQVDSKSRKANIAKIIKDTYKTRGLKGFWRGQTATALRETGGSAAWFSTYYCLKEDLGPLLAGAIAGISYNLSLYPADCIKSRMQTEDTAEKTGKILKKKSFWQTGVQIVKQNGVRGLYRGSLITCLRAGPSNAVIFSVHDYVHKLL